MPNNLREWTLGGTGAASVVLDGAGEGPPVALRPREGGLEVEVPAEARARLNDVQLRGRSAVRPGDVLQLGELSILLMVSRGGEELLAPFERVEPTLRQRVEADGRGALAVLEVRAERPRDRERLAAARAVSDVAAQLSGRAALFWASGAGAAARLRSIGRGGRTAIAEVSVPGVQLDALLSTALRRWFEVDPPTAEPVTADPVMVRLRELLERRDPAQAKVGLEGERFSGRSTLAKAVAARVFPDVDRLPLEAQRTLAARLSTEAGFALTWTRREAVAPELGEAAESVVFVPALRDRPLDVAAFSRALLDELPRVRLGVSAAAVALLQAHRWPGNYAELTQTLLRAAELAAETGQEVLPRHLPPSLQAPGGLEPGGDLRTSLRHAEREAMLGALTETRWNVSAAAQLLRLPRRTVVYRMRRLGLKRPAKVR